MNEMTPEQQMRTTVIRNPAFFVTAGLDGVVEWKSMVPAAVVIDCLTRFTAHLGSLRDAADGFAPARSVMLDVEIERVTLADQWGEQNHADGTGGTGRRLEADTAHEACEAAGETGMLTFTHILEEAVTATLAEIDETALRASLVRVAALAVEWVEALDRRAEAESLIGTEPTA